MDELEERITMKTEEIKALEQKNILIRDLSTSYSFPAFLIRKPKSEKMQRSINKNTLNCVGQNVNAKTRRYAGY